MSPSTRAWRGIAACTLTLTLALAACSDRDAATAPAGSPAFGVANTAPAPSALTTASWGGATLALWPYTTSDFTTPSDPVNLLFFNADPRTIRAALLGLDGDRTAFGLPASFPFNCVWTDVPDGGIQAVYADGAWQAGAIQLGCGNYDQVRFHLRLFRAGAWTVGGVHFEFLVPGTTTHKVLSWEAAEQFVALDMYRTGIAAPVDAAAINDAPSFRALEGFLVALLPAELRAVLCPAGVPWPCDGSADVPIVTDGNATVVYLWGDAQGQRGVTRRTSTVPFGQVIPKPFCTGGAYQYLYVSGPIDFREQWVLTPSNNYIATFHATGRLSLVPVDPATGTPLADPYEARVSVRQRMQVTDHLARAGSAELQMELPPNAPYHGRLVIRIDVGSNGPTGHDVSLRCGD